MTLVSMTVSLVEYNYLFVFILKKNNICTEFKIKGISYIFILINRKQTFRKCIYKLNTTLIKY